MRRLTVLLVCAAVATGCARFAVTRPVLCARCGGPLTAKATYWTFARNSQISGLDVTLSTTGVLTLKLGASTFSSDPGVQMFRMGAELATEAAKAAAAGR